MMRESVAGKVGGRTHEIQRLIGRSLRAVTDLESLRKNVPYGGLRCIQADGGYKNSLDYRRLYLCCRCIEMCHEKWDNRQMPLTHHLAAVSVGFVGGEPRLDLCYAEASGADVDINVVMTGDGRFVEIQGTSKNHPFPWRVLVLSLPLQQRDQEID